MALQDNIYGREVMVRPRKVMVTGRGGSGNARKSISSASTGSSPGSGWGASSLDVSTISGGTSKGSDRSARARRWSSASNEFGSIINITTGPDEGDGCDLYTISSHSTSTNISEALSDIPSYISEFTFKTSSNPSDQSARSRPSTRQTSRLSGQSDWSARIPKSYSSDSLPQPIPEGFDETPVSANSHQEITFRNPFAVVNNSSGVFSDYIHERSPIELAPFDDEPTPTGPAHAPGDSPSKGPKGPRVFRVFRRNVPSTSSHTPPSAFLGFPSKPGQSSETLVRSNSMPDGDNLSILDIRRGSASSTTTTRLFN